MKKYFLLSALCLALLAGACSSGKVSAHKADEEEALKSALRWLDVVDSGAYGDSWSMASFQFKEIAPKAEWERSLNAFRKPLGKLVSRKAASVNYTNKLPGAPDGDYVVIIFNTSYENKKQTVETVTPAKDKDGVWRVSGYYIN